MTLEIYDYNVTENVYRTSHWAKHVALLINLIVIAKYAFSDFYFGIIFFTGQQPKSTYLLLGNVSLADTIVGLSMMCGVSLDPLMTSDPLCIFQIGKYYFEL